MSKRPRRRARPPLSPFQSRIIWQSLLYTTTTTSTNGSASLWHSTCESDVTCGPYLGHHCPFYYGPFWHRIKMMLSATIPLPVFSSNHHRLTTNIWCLGLLKSISWDFQLILYSVIAMCLTYGHKEMRFVSALKLCKRRLVSWAIYLIIKCVQIVFPLFHSRKRSCEEGNLHTISEVMGTRCNIPLWHRQFLSITVQRTYKYSYLSYTPKQKHWIFSLVLMSDGQLNKGVDYTQSTIRPA